MNDLINTVNIDRLTISSKDRTISLKDIFVSINIYEDIFSKFLTGKLTFVDTNSLQTTLPILGGEDLEILFSYQGDKDKKLQKFKVYKLEQDFKVYSNVEQRKLEVLYFCSPEMLIDENITISQRFNNNSNSVINSLLEKLKTEKVLLNNSTSGNIDLVSNFWNPHKIIDYICSAQEKAHDFIFFENRNGFNFESLSYLLSQDSSSTLTMLDSQESLYSVNSILQFSINKYFNLIESLKLGVLGNTVFNLDPNIYGHINNSTDILESTTNNTSLGNNIIYSDEFINSNKTSASYKDIKSYRDQVMKSFLNYHLTIKLPGDTQKTVGQVYDINFRSFDRNNLEYNKLLSGNWFVTNINHEVIRGGKYFQNIKIVKNSLFNYDQHSTVKGKRNL